MKLSVCVDAVYRGKDFYASIEEIREIGYDTIEFWSWWDKDVEKVAHATRELGLGIASVCTKMESLVDASKREGFVTGLRESIEVAGQLGCKVLITQAGAELVGVPREEQRRSIIEGLKVAAPLLEEAGVMIVLEPLNTLVDHKGYYLYSSEEAFHIVREVGSPNVKLVFDIYHQQIMEGNVLANIIPNLGLIGHFHAAGNPGRHELSSGELHYGRIFEAIDAAGYEGYMGLEYFPVAAPADGLKALLGS
ncbi:hydroxypyruvate isomerase family protein [Paenibacillus sp. OV219]|uniref:hydroxypyruvate isomerase family protein n=1 Tax=Paenibacillus sp. OV219 TaxID=1884377 RepID=UPI0008B9A2DF|nr:TIM barrel protein [Paenibacillus sp. OV219]SEO75569.1 hydroxypyruvate isomerase [Paenibacillus sp. OV219]